MSVNNNPQNDALPRGLVPLLTAEDLSQLLRVTIRTIARLCERGDIPQPIKIGGGNRWRLDEIQRLLGPEVQRSVQNDDHDGTNVNAVRS